jgi:hypothetical protein
MDAAQYAEAASRRARRSEAPTKAAQTRAARRHLRIVRLVSQGKPVGPRKHCYLYGRSLDDTASVARGIGSECWQDVQAELRCDPNAPKDKTTTARNMNLLRSNQQCLTT